MFLPSMWARRFDGPLCQGAFAAANRKAGDFSSPPIELWSSMDSMTYVHLAHLQSETNRAAVFLSFLSFYISSSFKKEESLPPPWQAAAPELFGSTLSRANSNHAWRATSPLCGEVPTLWSGKKLAKAVQLAWGFQFNFHPSG